MASTETIRMSLARAEETVTLRPSRGQRTYVNVASIAEGTRCRVVEHHDELIVDIPKSIGGEGDGPSPSMILRAAISSCVAIGIKQWAARRNVGIDQVEVRLETDVDARGQLGLADDIPPGFLAIRLAIKVVSAADAVAVEDLVHTSLKYSPLMDLLGHGHVVETRLEQTLPEQFSEETVGEREVSEAHPALRMGQGG
jgi:uncharacterized OsmC-like protein